MKPVSDRVRELPEHLLTNLRLAVDVFECGALDCCQCPLCDELGICIGRAATNELIRRKA